MKDRFNQEMDKISLDKTIERETLNKMKEYLNKKKKLKWRLVPVTAFALVLVLAIGFFASNLGTKGKPNMNIAYGENLMEGIVGEKIKTLKKFSEEFLGKTRDLSIDMFKIISQEENAVYSPTPLYLALGLVANGSEGQTKEEILNLLKDKGISEEDLNIYYKSLIDNLSKKSEDLEVDIVNSIWYDDNFEVYKEYLEKNKTYYDANAYQLDLQSAQAPETMNKWVRQVSRGKIDKMIEEIDEEVVMYLFSSIYFDGKWQEAFKKEATFQEEFYLNKDEKIVHDFMHRDGHMLYIDNKEEQGILLPYKGNKYAFLALMPSENTSINDYIRGLNKDSLETKISLMEEKYLYLSLPKFEVEYGRELVDDLKFLGIERAFDINRAELFGMGKAKGNLYVSDVAQKTYLKVDEEGTEAASIVKVEVKDESASMGEVINFNRPFIYAIMDLENNLPIFMGVMNNPGK